jgi:DNA polymerase-1
MNMPIQGTCADIVKYALVQIQADFQKQNIEAHLLLSIHDELVVECPDTEKEKVTKIMKTIMENIVHWDIPMSVEIGVGKNWREAKK